MESKRFNWQSCLLCMTVLLLIILPNIYYRVAHDDAGVWFTVESIFFAAPIALLITYLPQRTVQILLTTACSLVSIIEILSVFTYYHFTNAISIPALLYSNSSETNDMTYYITHFSLQHDILPVVLYIIAVVFIFLCYQTNWQQLKRNSLIWIGSVVFAIGLNWITRGNIYAHSPYHLAREIHSAWQEKVQREKLLPQAQDFRYNATTTDSTHNAIIVLAIGESVNYSHCSLNHAYPRHTMSQLEKIDNLISYSDYYSTATYTQQSLPMLLTRATACHFEQNYQELPLAVAFREAGYKTAIISHRSQIMNNGVHDYLTQGADTVVFTDHDRDIVAALQAISAQEGNQLVIVHFLGNHFFYSNYPACYNKWQPNYTYSPDAPSDSLFINAYDNSLLYTDSLLAACIHDLADQHRPATFVFTSDHGEYLDHHVGGHGLSCNPTKDEYHVPLFIWYSDEYNIAHSQKIANMIAHQDAAICGDNIFWTMLDLADIQIDVQLQQKNMSIAQDSLEQHERWLLLPDMISKKRLD